GEARLERLSLADRRGSFAVGIFAAAARDRGLGTEATRLVLGYAFDVMRLHRLELRVLADNARAIAVYERCGFVAEGIERETAQVGGRWVSDLRMSILEQEWRAVAGAGPGRGPAGDR